MDRLKNPKLIAAVIVAALAAIVFFQNQQEATVRVLFLFTAQTTLAKALGLSFLGGLVTGALAFSRWQSQRQRANAKDQGPS